MVKPLSRVDRNQRVFLAVAALGVAVHGIWALAGGGPRLVVDWLYCGLFFLAAASCAYRALRGDARGPWAVAAVGVLLWGCAEVVYRIAAPDPHELYPQVTQVMLFCAFSLAYTTLYLLARERVQRFDPVLGMDGVLAGLAAAALAAVLLFPVGHHHTETPAPPSLFLIGALVGLMFVVTVLGMTGWRPGPAWALIVIAITVNVLGDGVLVHLADDDRFYRGSIADTLFVSSALLLGLAAFYPSRQIASPPHSSVRRLPAPLIAAATGLGVLIAAETRLAGGLAAGLAAAVLAVMIARMSIALELLERSRRLALADDLTGLGNRRRLVRDLTRRLSPEHHGRPFTLALFDLDGFKRYNDTFGHPSGDALLVRLADRLSAAVGPGVAYRMGGDEFCAIIEGDTEDADRALRRAEAALSEAGDAFSITSSSGTARCPTEAPDVAGALRLADGRMYVAKTGRAIDRAQTRDMVLKMLHERDPGLHDHLRAVAAIAAEVASQMGLAELTRRQIEHAAELHDIGKIALPDAILHKSGRLDASERRFMREYPIIGERILRAAPALAPLAPLIRSSKERWDGNGYPDGLRGEATPLGARIIAVCDAYHSMRSVQPYRSSRSQDAAVAELERCAGTQFDPSVVHALRIVLAESAVPREFA
jgi:two-component system, cell cycle response regulator